MTTDIDIRSLQRLVRQRYAIGADADTIADSLDGITDVIGGCDPAETAERLTARLQTTNNDRHLRVRYRPDGASSGFDRAAHEARYAAEAVRTAGGMRQVTRLDEHTGLLAIAPHTSPVHLAAPYVAAAFALLTGVDHLIIDLRDGHGGTPETIALLVGHLLGPEPVHLQDLVERGGSVRQFWTSPAASAARIDEPVPIHVLTSGTTFSGCEELAYNLQALGRATVVGETTGGGAHPVEAFRLTDVLEAHIPLAVSVNVVTGTNWEQVGVLPDLACPAEEALNVALAAAGRHPVSPVHSGKMH